VVSIDCIHALQSSEQRVDIFSIPGMNEIEIERGNGCPVQDAAYASYDDELHLVLR
jgi:hypothetical protein